MCAQQLSSRYAYVDPDRAAEFNFSNQEWGKITDALTRNPNSLEALILGRAWSDELTGKSGALFLRGVYREDPNATPKLGSSLAALNIGFDEQVVLSARQVNHLGRTTPTLAIQTAFAELIQELSLAGVKPLGAGIVIHAGDIDSSRATTLLTECVHELSDFATKAALPVLEHQIYCHPRYEGIPIINMTAWGVRQSTDKPLPPPEQELTVYYAGKRPSAICSRLGSPPRVARIDPSETYEFASLLQSLAQTAGVHTGSVVGRGGLALAGATLAGAAIRGIQVNLDPFISGDGKKGGGLEEILFSEAPLRALFLVSPEAGREFSDKVSAAGFLAVQVGSATKGNFLEYLSQHQLLASLPYSLFADSTEQKTLNLISNPPMLHRSARKELANDLEDSGKKKTSKLKKGVPLEDRWLDLLANPNVASRRILNRLQDTWGGGLPLNLGRTDASLTRIPAIESRNGTRPERVLGVSLVSLPLLTSIDPYLGGAHAVADGCRRLAATGCSPLAAIQLLNFGNPEDYRQISEFAEAVRGMSDTCRLWSIPILSDTVSFRNTIGSTSALPTPAVIICGIVPSVSSCCKNALGERGHRVLLIGENRPELASSEFQRFFSGDSAGPVANIDFTAERRVSDLVCELIENSLLVSAKSVSLGGVGSALADSAFRREKPIGTSLTYSSESSLEGLLFGESGGRFLISCTPENEKAVRERVTRSKVPITAEGTVGGKELTVKNSNQEVSVPIGAAFQIWANAVGSVLGVK